jgi:hypothetical protein
MHHVYLGDGTVHGRRPRRPNSSAKRCGETTPKWRDRYRTLIFMAMKFDLPYYTTALYA